MYFEVFRFYFQEMKKHLHEFSQHCDLSHVDCIFVVLLSHGKDNEGVYGVDGCEIAVQDIFNMFSAAQCPAMIEKPKMFIINACRGGEVITLIMGVLEPGTGKSYQKRALENWILNWLKSLWEPSIALNTSLYKL